MNDLFSGYGVIVTLPSPGSFLSIAETLTRMGISSKDSKTLWQSVHILHKRGQYALCHFKEMLALDNKPSTLNENDIGRRNTIASLLEEWGLLYVTDPEEIKSPRVPVSQIKIITYKNRNDWNLQAKYHFGGNNGNL